MSNCPSCQSSNTKKMAMVWAGGSRTGQSRSTGIGVSSRGTIGIGASRGRSSSQSHLAAACAPPQKSSLAKIVAAILFVLFWIPAFSGVIGFLSSSSFVEGFFRIVLGVPILALVTYGIIKIYQKLDGESQQQISDYAKTWVCLRCGTQFIPND